jgi:hypothetical protein
MVSNMSIYSNTSISDALSMPVSVIHGFFESDAFADLVKRKEYEVKCQSAIVSRLNGVITAIANTARRRNG